MITMTCSYSGTGLQAVLELYFAPFLYVCSGVSRAKKLSTTSVNVYIAVYQLCALSAGFLADKVFGERSLTHPRDTKVTIMVSFFPHI